MGYAQFTTLNFSMDRSLVLKWRRAERWAGYPLCFEPCAPGHQEFLVYKRNLDLSSRDIHLGSWRVYLCQALPQSQNNLNPSQNTKVCPFQHFTLNINYYLTTFSHFIPLFLTPLPDYI
uniref:Putative ovule protein n=1 Tax=Solanum chacoense TaxID=4108 RepID=A0A0V0ID61_SOLCH